MQTEDKVPFDVNDNVGSELSVIPAGTATVTIEQLQAVEVARFTTTEDLIKGFKKKFGKLTIEGPEDKKGYKAVEEALSLVRPARTQIAKDKKLIKERYTAVGKALDKRQAELEALIEPLETHLKAQKDFIDGEIERKKEEAKQAKDKLVNARVAELLKYCSFDGEFYSIGESLSLNGSDVAGISEEMYNGFIGRVREEYDAQQLLKLEKEEEDRKLKAKALADAEKLAADQAELVAEKEKMKATILRARSRVLTGAGFFDHDGKYYLPEKPMPDHTGQPSGVVITYISAGDVSELSDDAFYSWMDDAEAAQKKQYENRVAEAAQKTRVANRSTQLAELGLMYNYGVKVWAYKSQSGTVSIDHGFVEHLNDEEFTGELARLELELSVMQEKEQLRIDAALAETVKAKEEKDAKLAAEAEAKRQAALDALPDYDKILNYIDGLTFVPRPEIVGTLQPFYYKMLGSIQEAKDEMWKILKRVSDAAAQPVPDGGTIGGGKEGGE